MSRSWPRRGQTEPLAALVAIAAVCLAVGLYAASLGDVLPGTSDRDPADVTLERLWNAVGDGVYHEDRDRSAFEDVRTPAGYVVYAEVTTVTDDGEEIAVDPVVIDPEGDLRSGDDADRPDDPQRATRPIGVQLERDPAGTVRSGTLRVEVWRR